MIKFYTKLVDRISTRNVELIGYGKAIIFVVIGSYFSTSLVFYSLYLLAAAFILTLFTAISFFTYYFKKTKVGMGTIVIAGLAMFTMSLLFGMQVPLPFRGYVLAIGIVLTLPGGYQLFFGGKK